jgi:hypothetical protein
MYSHGIDGIEIPYAIENIEKIDQDIVGHATLFTTEGDSIIIAELKGRIRELLIDDYRRRSPGTFPELVMYSGSRQKQIDGDPFFTPRTGRPDPV